MSEKIKVCILGCGAIGGIFAAHLAMNKNVEVWAYDLNEDHVDQINQHGLKLSGACQHIARVNATTCVDSIPECQIGILTTKNLHTRAAIEATSHLFKHGIVCSMQNGVGNEEIIAEYVTRVISGTTLLGGHVLSPGNVHVDSKGVTWIGSSVHSPTGVDTRPLIDMLSSSGLNIEFVNNSAEIKWRKLIFNSAANPLCALSGLSFGEMYQDTELRKLMFGLAKEGISVSKALGISFSKDPIDMLNNAYTTSRNHIPSMLTDVKNRRLTEIDSLNGSIIKYGDLLGVACPLNKKVTGLIKNIESSWIV